MDAKFRINYLLRLMAFQTINWRMRITRQKSHVTCEETHETPCKQPGNTKHPPPLLYVVCCVLYAVCCMLCVVCCVLCVVCCVLYVVCCVLYLVCCMLCVVCCVLYVVCCVLCVVCCVLCVVCCVLYVVCCMLYVVCCMLCDEDFPQTFKSASMERVYSLLGY